MLKLLSLNKLTDIYLRFDKIYGNTIKLIYHKNGITCKIFFVVLNLLQVEILTSLKLENMFKYFIDFVIFNLREVPVLLIFSH